MTHLPMKTPNAFAHRLASLQSRAWLPPALLLLALSAVFLFGGDQRGYFTRSFSYGEGIHDEISAKNMAIVEDLSIDHHFVMVQRQVLDADGEPAIRVYNRFPIGSYALTKLATLPFGNDLSAKVYAAKTLMLLFFAAAAVMAYLALARLASNRWIALTATLLAFSSPFCLYYGDAITSEAIVDIFGMLLVFHGMVVFKREGRFRQLAVKTCAALLLGWHVYALLLPFIAFGLMRELIKTRLDGSAPLIALRQIKHTSLSLLRSRYLALGVIALAFGISMLAINFTNEYFALNRETPLTELASFRSMLTRISGVDITYTGKPNDLSLSWPVFLERQFHRVGAQLLPYAFSPTFVDHDHRSAMLQLLVMLGIAASAASLIGLLFVRRHKILLASLALSGFCWALPMRNTTSSPFHHFEGLFYIGVSLTLFTIILLCLRRFAGERFVAALSVAALLIFASSALRMSQQDNPIQTVELQEAATADFEVIRNATDGKAILINSMPRFLNRRSVVHYYLAGRPIQYGYETGPADELPFDFIVTGARADGLASLTPQTRIMFLYEWNAYHRHITETIAQASVPIIRSGFFDVYLNGNSLIYVKDDCSGDDTAAPFELRAYPVNESDLPARYRQHGFQNLSFSFTYNGIRLSDGRCVSIAQLPDYDINHISTGQNTRQADGSYESLWKGEFRQSHLLINALLKDIDETTAREPLIRSDFNVYISDDTLIYVKDACGNDDTDARFFLAAHPVNKIDLPEGARQYGFQNLAFDFKENGIRLSDGRCVAIAQLPDYDITRISTGQYIKHADGSYENLWKGGFRQSDRLINDRMRHIDETIAQAGEPLIRSDFDAYLHGNTLVYVKDACRMSDTAASFFLALFPADESALPVESRQYGFQNLDFAFHENGIRSSGGRCVALIQLPDYDIARISTGQYTQGADGSTEHLWEGEFRPTEASR